MDSRCTAFTTDLWEYDDLPRFDQGAVVDGFILLDVEICLCNLSKTLA